MHSSRQPASRQAKAVENQPRPKSAPIRIRRASEVSPAKPALPANPAPPPPVVVKQPPPPAVKPEPKPDSPSVATQLPFRGCELPVVPLTESDVPCGVTVRLGVITRTRHRRTGRPFINLQVHCICRKEQHVYCWRGDWPFDLSVRSHQQSQCENQKPGKLGDSVWLAIDPARIEESRQTWQDGRDAFSAWLTWWLSLPKEVKTAIQKGRAMALLRKGAGL